MNLTMKGRLDPCFLLSYSVPEKAIAGLLPEGLFPLTCRGFAFLNIVISRILAMRPTGIPSALGLSYWHIAYRVHTRASLASHKTTDGLYFLRSDVDRSLPVIPGNLLTDFRFHKASIRASSDGAFLRVTIKRTLNGIADAEVAIGTAHAGDYELSPPFHTASEREGILKYAPLGLSVDRSGGWLKVAEVKREEGKWEERAVRIQLDNWEYLQRRIPGETRLVRATQVAPIDYRWRLGRKERL